MEKATDDVARVDVAVRTSRQTPLCGEEDAERALKTASRIADLFKRILIDHFVTEMPELGEPCLKCHWLTFQRRFQTSVQQTLSATVVTTSGPRTRLANSRSFTL
ncbi:MAG: hypothetical protein ABSB28_02260 [Candidatus Bathyarchaeia archaeon]